MTLDDLLTSFPARQRLLLVAATEIYGDGTDDLLNAFQEIAARIGILTGVEPDTYAAGMKHHWDHFANAINDAVEQGR